MSKQLFNDRAIRQRLHEYLHYRAENGMQDACLYGNLHTAEQFGIGIANLDCTHTNEPSSSQPGYADQHRLLQILRRSYSYREWA